MPFCRKCGVELLPDDKFCPNCGATYTPPTLRQAGTEAPATTITEPAKATPSPQPQPAPQPVQEPTKNAPTPPPELLQGKHTFQGYVSIIVAILGLGVYFIPIGYSDRFTVLIFAFFIEVIAVTAGSKAIEKGDKFGTYALIIAAIVIILGVITLLIT
jgi:hypothetical protein